MRYSKILKVIFFSANSPNFDDNRDLTDFLMDIKDVKYMKFKTVSRLGFISPSLPPRLSFRRTLPPRSRRRDGQAIVATAGKHDQEAAKR